MNSFGSYGYDAPVTRTVPVADANAFLSRVFSWMFAGLLLTGIVGWYVANSGLAQSILSGGMFIVLMLAELGLVVWLSAGINKMEPGTATGLFLLYCALSGVTFSVIFLMYAMGSILNVLMMTALLFGMLALFGKTTAMDLRKVGSIAFIGLIAVIIASLVNMFLLHSTGLDLLISIVAMAVFAGLTAFRVQKIMAYANSAGRTEVSDARYAIIGALGLYLSFINMFLTLLRLFGGGRRR